MTNHYDHAHKYVVTINLLLGVEATKLPIKTDNKILRGRSTPEFFLKYTIMK
jgi:hypothetical protein